MDEVPPETRQILDQLARDVCRICRHPKERHPGANSIYAPTVPGSAPETHAFAQ